MSIDYAECRAVVEAAKEKGLITAPKDQVQRPKKKRRIFRSRPWEECDMCGHWKNKFERCVQCGHMNWIRV